MLAKKIVFFLTFALLATANGWEVSRNSSGIESYSLRGKDKKIVITNVLTAMSGEKYFIKSVPVNKDIVLLVYRAGVEGTSVKFKVDRAYVYNVITKKILSKGLTYRVFRMNDEPIEEADRPKWIFKDREIEIIINSRDKYNIKY